jgi:hypothetical protein
LSEAVGALRASVVTGDCTDVLNVNARCTVTVDDASSTAVLSNNTFATPVGTIPMIYMLSMAHLQLSPYLVSKAGLVKREEV